MDLKLPIIYIKNNIKAKIIKFFLLFWKMKQMFMIKELLKGNYCQGKLNR